MARKAREILKEQGYTDEELNGLALLNDPRFCKTLETQDAERENLATLTAKQKADLEATGKWYREEAMPTVNKMAKEVVTYKSEIARLKSQLETEQELGLRRVADQDGNGDNKGDQNGGNGNGNGNRQPVADPQLDERFVTRDAFQQAFEQTGTAIAMGNDIAEDHRDLFGKRLPGGLGALRENYRKATETGFRGNLRDYWMKEYNVPAKQQEIEKAEREKHEADIRADERRKVTQEYMNPHTRTMEASRSPFIRSGKQGELKDGVVDGEKQPWERGSVEQRRSQRVVKFGTAVLNKNTA